MEQISYVLLSFFFFSLPLIPPWCPLAFPIFSPPLQNFHVVVPIKKMSLCYLSLLRSVSLFLVELRWPGAYFLVFPVFLLYCKFLDLTIKLSFILQTTRIQKGFSLSVFVFIDSLIVSASQDTCGYAISRQNNLELRLGCRTCGLSYPTFVCLSCGRTGGRSGVRSRNMTRISRMRRLPHFLRYGAMLARPQSF